VDEFGKLKLTPKLSHDSRQHSEKHFLHQHLNRTQNYEI